MVGFLDRALLQLRRADALTDLLKGAPVGPYPKLERLLQSVYRPDGAAVDSIADVTVRSVRPMVGLARKDAVNGTIQTSQPAYSLVTVRGDIARADDAQWAHVMAGVQLDVVVAVDPGGVESALTRAIENITSFDDFASRFRYLDLDSFLAERRITTVQQLRDDAEYLLAEVHFLAPPPFDPTDPANSHSVALDLAVTVVEQLDLGAGLRAARLLQAAGAVAPPASADPLLGPAATPFAVAVVFPAAELGPQQPTAAEVDELFAAAGVLPLFANPP